MAWLAKIFGSAVLKFSGLSGTVKAYIYFGALLLISAAWAFSVYKAYNIGSTVGEATVTAKYAKAEKAMQKKIAELETTAKETAIDNQAKEKKIADLQDKILTEAPKVRIVTKEGQPLNCVVAPPTADQVITEAVLGSGPPLANLPDEPSAEFEWYLDTSFAKTWNAVILVQETVSEK